jgi:hypothetical protein
MPPIPSQGLKFGQHLLSIQTILVWEQHFDQIFNVCCHGYFIGPAVNFGLMRRFGSGCFTAEKMARAACSGVA